MFFMGSFIVMRVGWKILVMMDRWYSFKHFVWHTSKVIPTDCQLSNFRLLCALLGCDNCFSESVPEFLTIVEIRAVFKNFFLNGLSVTDFHNEMKDGQKGSAPSFSTVINGFQSSNVAVQVLEVHHVVKLLKQCCGIKKPPVENIWHCRGSKHV